MRLRNMCSVSFTKFLRTPVLSKICRRLQDLGHRAFKTVFPSELLIFLIKILRTFGLSEVEVPRKSSVYVCMFSSE